MRRVLPAAACEQFCDVVVILEPNGEVDVVVQARDLAYVEVDGLAAKEPVIDAAVGQRLNHACERRELLRVLRHDRSSSTADRNAAGCSSHGK